MGLALARQAHPLHSSLLFFFLKSFAEGPWGEEAKAILIPFPNPSKFFGSGKGWGEEEKTSSIN